jgi:hypothetical protein
MWPHLSTRQHLLGKLSIYNATAPARLLPFPPTFIPRTGGARARTPGPPSPDPPTPPFTDHTGPTPTAPPPPPRLQPSPKVIPPLLQYLTLRWTSVVRCFSLDFPFLPHLRFSSGTLSSLPSAAARAAGLPQRHGSALRRGHAAPSLRGTECILYPTILFVLPTPLRMMWSPGGAVPRLTPGARDLIPPPTPSIPPLPPYQVPRHPTHEPPSPPIPAA